MTYVKHAVDAESPNAGMVTFEKDGETHYGPWVTDPDTGEVRLLTDAIRNASSEYSPKREAAESGRLWGLHGPMAERICIEGLPRIRSGV